MKLITMPDSSLGVILGVTAGMLGGKVNIILTAELPLYFEVISVLIAGLIVLLLGEAISRFEQKHRYVERYLERLEGSQ